MNISHEQYSTNEQMALRNVGFLVSEVFSNAFFHKQGRMTNEESALSFWKYIDAHHDNRKNRVTGTLLGGAVDELELETLEAVYKKMESFCKHYNVSFSAQNVALLRALFQLRVIRFFSPDALSGKVAYEIGPGSGWLSNMLAFNGVQVHAIENTQSHYVFQSAVFAHLWEGRLHETASEGDLVFTPRAESSIVHLPWWKVCAMKGQFPSADILTSNHMLLECSHWCLAFYAAFANRILSKQGMWIIEGRGAQYHTGPTMDSFARLLRPYGLELHDMSYAVPDCDGIFIASRIGAVQPRRVANDIPLDLSYFSKKYDFCLSNDSTRLSSGEFLKLAGIDH